MSPQHIPPLHVLNAHMEELMPLVQEQLAGGRSVRFMPKGISMLPMLRQGIDSVEISPLPETIKKYDLPLYQRPDGHYVLHRVVRVGETYTCMGDNQFVEEPGVSRDWMIGIVTAFYRDKKRHSVHGFGYWLYCRVWYYSRHVRHFWKRGVRFLRRCLR